MSYSRLRRHWLWCVAAVCAWLAAATGSSVFARGGIESYLEGFCHNCETCYHGRLERALRFGEAWEAGQRVAAGFDETTGRDLRHFPPDRHVDYQHMKLQMHFENLDDRRFTAVETLSFIPIGRAASSLTLNAAGLKITSVTLAGSPIEFSYDGQRLALRFDPPLPVGELQELVIEYVCERPYDGMIFTPASPDVPQYTPEVHTQGQPETNRHWFVCHDYPNERMTTELIVDVPAAYSVSSNGRLVSHLTTGDRAVWHWLQDKPHVPYLVTLVIGTFDIVEIPHDRVPMKVWVPQGLGDQVMQTYGRTGDMIDLFEQRFGVPYPWDRYDQLVVKNFGAGGMENTSATSMYPTAILDSTALLDGDLDGLIAHELAHQWTGDLITCKSWAHIWLNEGWATYCSALWNERRFGEDGYLDSMRGNFGVAHRDRTTNSLPMVSPIYDKPFDVFRRAANPYPKGASILHMLRMMLGEDVFWKGVHLYMNRHAGGLVETNDFRYAMEEVSGLGLEWFFEQWCYRPGTPELNVQVRYEAASRELFIDVEQTQHIDERTPAFRFVLPVVARTLSGERTLTIDVTERSTSFRTTLDGPPTMVAIDPYLHVLKTITVEKPLGMWIEQAKSGPTIASRHAAVEALSCHDVPDVIALLKQILANEDIRYTLRNTAADSLAQLASPEAKDALLDALQTGIAEARVRANLVSKLRGFEKDRVVSLLATIAGSDPSYATRVQAIEALAHHKAHQYADLIVELVEFKSQHDQVRNAALRALANLDDPRGLDLGIKYAAYGYMDRSRPVAIDVIGQLAKHDQDRAVAVLLPLLHDPEWRTVIAAGAALAHIGDKRAVDPIAAIARSHPDPSMQDRAERWLKRLQGEN